MALIDLQMDLRETNRQLTRIADLLERLVPSPTELPDGQPKRATMHRPDDYARYEAWAGGLFEEGRGAEVEAQAYEPRK